MLPCFLGCLGGIHFGLQLVKCVVFGLQAAAQRGIAAVLILHLRLQLVMLAAERRAHIFQLAQLLFQYATVVRIVFCLEGLCRERYLLNFLVQLLEQLRHAVGGGAIPPQVQFHRLIV